MSEYSATQRKEQYTFNHLEIEFDWPEDESPEQERTRSTMRREQLNAAFKKQGSKTSQGPYRPYGTAPA